MSWKNPEDRWGAVSQAFHWLIVVLIVVMGYLGLTMTELPNSPHKIAVYSLHKSIGLTLLALVILRLLWRLAAGAPRAIPTIPRWQARIAALTHGGLYVLLLAMPISGWVLNSTAGFPLRWFGLVNLPAIAAKSEAGHDLALATHETLFWILVTLALVHAAAAFYHHLFQHDATLSRMLPRNWLQAPMPGPTPLSNQEIRNVDNAGG
jgi:cytochrome b561